MQATINGVKLNYEIDGREGAPWVTMVTGIANDLTMWDGQLPALTNDLRILRYDFRGHGGSQSSPPPYSMDMLRSDLVGLWDHLGIERTHLVALGLGGAMILGAAAEHPERIDRLVPCCCRAKMVPDFAEMWQGLITQVKANGVEFDR